MPLTNQGARIVDPILTTVAQGYGSEDFVGNALFPEVPVFAAGGQIVEFDRAAFRLYASRRTPGSNTNEVQFGYAGRPFALQNHRMMGIVPREHLRDAAAAAGIQLDQVGVQGAMRAIRLALEVDQATLATAAGTYGAGNKVTLSGATKWSTSTGSPLTDIDTGREAIRQSCGVYPNTLVLSAVAFNACKNNPNVISRFQYNGQVSPAGVQITPQMLGGLFNVANVVVGAGVYWTDADAPVDIWGNNAVLAYVPQGSEQLRDRYMPSYGYTYVMSGHPIAEPAFWDNARASWKYPVEMERVPVVSGISAGYLIISPN